MSASDRAPIYRKDYRPPDYLVDRVDLRLDLDSQRTIVTSRLGIRRNPLAATGPTLVLNGHDHELLKLSIDGVELDQSRFIKTSESLTVLDVPEAFELKLQTAICPSANTALEGLYQSGDMLCTQCEAEGFSRITYFIDRPDVMSRYRVTLVADRARYPLLLSNGNPVAQGEQSDGRHWVTWEDPFPKPCYLFAVVAGNLALVEDSFRTRSGRDVALRIYVEPENRNRCSHAMTSLKQAMRWDEETYGLEYDLDIFMIVAVGTFNMGAMENKGLNIFNAKYILATPETATDRDYEAVRDIIGHEYFHNWTGNRVTCRDWFQLSLKESLTVFREQQFSAAMSASSISRIEHAELVRSQQFAEDTGPTAHPVRPESYLEVNNFYTLTVYEKGAEVIRMMHSLLGDDEFRKGMALYFSRHDGQAVTIEDFVSAMESVNDRDLGQFRLWYSVAGTPRVVVSDSYDENGARYTLSFHQSCSAMPGPAQKAAMHIPVSMTLVDPDRGILSGTEQVFELREESQTCTFENISARPVPSLLRGFSAPVKLEYAYSDAQLRQLVTHEKDAFSRWDAAQRLMLNSLKRAIVNVQSGRKVQEEGELCAAFAQLLELVNDDAALQAEMLQLPGESYLAEQMPVIDVDAVVAAHDGLRLQLASSLKDNLQKLYFSIDRKEVYRFDSRSVALRRLRNTCLAWLGEIDQPDIRQFCLDQFRHADNLTDAMAALQALNLHDSAERTLAMDEFHSRWSKDALVLDKWLTLQATSHIQQTPERVKTLLSDTRFDWRNPNRIRALLGSFIQGNLRGFHRRDGVGYQMAADQVIAIDAINPQVAARLVMGFSRWARYPALRGKLMHSQLKRVAATSELSPDVHEIVAKCLKST